jgi:hypothetical protein
MTLYSRVPTQVGVQSKDIAVSKFVLHNEYDNLSCGSMNLPTSVVNSREIHKGAMLHVCPPFFHLVCLMEALYKVNLNPVVAVTYQDNFFCKVDELVKNSKELALLFNNCIPSNHSSNKQKQFIDGLFKLILHTYGSLQACDML